MKERFWILATAHSSKGCHDGRGCRLAVARFLRGMTAEGYLHTYSLTQQGPYWYWPHAIGANGRTVIDADEYLYAGRVVTYDELSRRGWGRGHADVADLKK